MEEKWRLRADQVDAAKDLIKAQRALFRGKRGYGKTAVLCSILRTDFTIVVTPNLGGAGIRQWQHQAKLWAPGTPTYAYVGPKRGDALDAWLDDEPGFLVTNYETMARDVAELEGRAEVLIFDEAHRLKNYRGVWTKAAKKLARKAPYLYLATGTPVVSKGADLWPLLHLIDPKTYSSYWRWVNEHCDVDTRFFKGREVRVVGGIKHDHLPIVREQLGEHLVDPPAPPPVAGQPVQKVLEVTLSPKERKLYEQLKRHYYAEWGDDVIVAPNDITKLGRLRQITSEWSAVVDADEAGSKVKATAEYVNDLEEPVVVMAEYQATVERLAALVPGSAVFHGGRNDVERGTALENFRCGTARVIIGTLATMSEGLDGLQHRARELVLVDRPWTPKGVDQAIGRLDRTGQTEQVIVTHVTAADTTDAKVAQAIAEKRELAEALGLD